MGVLAVTQSAREVDFEFAAIVGLPDEVAERDTVAIRMLLDAGSEGSAGRCAAVLGEGPEGQATADVAAQPQVIRRPERNLTEALRLRRRRSCRYRRRAVRCPRSRANQASGDGGGWEGESGVEGCAVGDSGGAAGAVCPAGADGSAAGGGGGTCCAGFRYLMW